MYLGLAVRDSAPMVRPWKARVNVTISVAESSSATPAALALALATRRENLIAASFACRVILSALRWTPQRRWATWWDWQR